MIVRSRIRQSFQRRFGFVLERGDNRFNEPLPLPVARTFEALRRAKLVTLLSEEEYAAEQSPALASAASSQRLLSEEEYAAEQSPALASAASSQRPKRKRK